MPVPATAAGISVVIETKGVADGSNITVEVGSTDSFGIVGAPWLATALFGVWLDVLWHPLMRIKRTEGTRILFTYFHFGREWSITIQIHTTDSG